MKLNLIFIVVYIFRLLDGFNVSSSDEHMWMIPFTEGGDHFLTIDFGREVQMTGLRIWNYNKTPEDTYRGVRFED